MKHSIHPVVRAATAVAAGLLIAINPLGHVLPAEAATSTTASLLSDGGFENGVPQSAWSEQQSSGAELIDTIDPHSGSWAADLCDIDNCRNGSQPGDTLVQAFTDPGQVISATLTYSYNVGTSEANQNAACHDWLSIGLGLGTAIDTGASKKYCTSTNASYVTDSIDETAWLQAHGGQSADVQLEGYTDNLYPSEFFVDDVSLNVTYSLTPSAPAVASIPDCSVGSTTLTWQPPQFPLGNAYPVQSYTVTPYNVNGVAQPSTTVSGSTTSLNVSLQNGTVCYFTVTATNANGTGVPGSPSTPVAAVAQPATPSTTQVNLSWSPQPASAPATSWTVWSRDGSGPWLAWQTSGVASSTVFGIPGHTFSWYVQGTGAAGSGPGPSGNGQLTVAFPANATPVMHLKGLYGLDAYGTLHPAGSPPLANNATWNWQIARGITVAPSGTGGYILDGFGGVHPFGSAPGATGTAYWAGWDIARGIAVRPDGASGYVLDGFGGVHPFGGAPSLSISAYWSGWDIARGIVLDPAGTGGYVLDGFGGLHPFGDAKPTTISGYWSGWDIARGVAMRPDGTGGWVLDGFGGIHPFGSAPSEGITGYWSGWDIARGLVVDSSQTGGYVIDGLGGFHAFGTAPSAPFTPNWSGAAIIRGVSGA